MDYIISVARGGGSGGTRPGAHVLGAHHHTLFSHLKTPFKQKNMLKNVYFLQKRCKIAAASRAPPPDLRVVILAY